MKCKCKDFKKAKRKYGVIKLKNDWSINLTVKEIITITQLYDTQKNTIGMCCFCGNHQG